MHYSVINVNGRSILCRRSKPEITLGEFLNTLPRYTKNELLDVMRSYGVKNVYADFTAKRIIDELKLADQFSFNKINKIRELSLSENCEDTFRERQIIYHLDSKKNIFLIGDKQTCMTFKELVNKIDDRILNGMDDSTYKGRVGTIDNHTRNLAHTIQIALAEAYPKD